MPIPPILHPPLHRVLRTRATRHRHGDGRRHHTSLHRLHLGTPYRQERGGGGRAVRTRRATDEEENSRRNRREKPRPPLARRRDTALCAILGSRERRTLERRHRGRHAREPRLTDLRAVNARPTPPRTPHAGQPVSVRIRASSPAIAAGSAVPSSSRSIASASVRARRVARRISLATAVSSIASSPAIVA